jgi:hypothetical protein
MRLSQERKYDIPESRVAWVEDRDPVLPGIDRVREDAVDRGVVGCRIRTGESLVRRPSDPDVESENSRTG